MSWFNPLSGDDDGLINGGTDIIGGVVSGGFETIDPSLDEIASLKLPDGSSVTIDRNGNIISKL